MFEQGAGRLAPFNMTASSRVSADIPPKPFYSVWGIFTDFMPFLAESTPRSHCKAPHNLKKPDKTLHKKGHNPPRALNLKFTPSLRIFLDEKPMTEKPMTEKPMTEKPMTENQPQLNTNKSNTKELK